MRKMMIRKRAPTMGTPHSSNEQCILRFCSNSAINSFCVCIIVLLFHDATLILSLDRFW